MNPLHLPWLELAIAVAVLGALIVSRFREPAVAFHWGLGFNGAACGCALLAWLSFHVGTAPAALLPYSLQPDLFGRQLFALDVVSAPLAPAVCLLHFLTALATARTKIRRFSLTWSLIAEAIQLLVFSSRDSWILVGLLVAGTVPPFFELLNRGRSVRVYAFHMALFNTLLLVGWYGLQREPDYATEPAQAAVALMASILIHCGTVPAHCWVTDWFDGASFGPAITYVTPLTGVYAALRLVLPVAPAWVLQSIGLFSLVTAVYAAAMATLQREPRRFFAYLFLSNASLVLVGLELHTPMTLTAALCLWFSAMLSLAGFGLTLRAFEARYGRLALDRYHGRYEQSPTLAVCFLLTGLASVGFPGTLGFISTGLLVDGTVQFNLYIGFTVVAATALSGIAVVRSYLLFFTGSRHASTVTLAMGLRERIAVLTLAGLILGGGLLPQPGVMTRYEAARSILREREARLRRVTDGSLSDEVETTNTEHER
jgi:NADH-quinone oxidoreductase subunit M